MELIRSQKLLKTGIFTVTKDHAVDPDGFHITRAIVQHAGSAVVMPVRDNEILLIKQYRLPARQYLWEIPAGRLDPGENALQAAKRELREETGLRAARWRRLAEFYASPGFLAEKMTLFLAEHLTEGEQKPMDDERIEMRWFDAAELDDLIASQQVPDAKTMLAFLLWRRYHGQRRRF